MKKTSQTKESALDTAINRAIDEIKIIQDKINKLGDDRLKVKTWSITLILAALLSGKSVGLNPLGYLTLLLIPLVFLNYEGYLNHQIDCLGKRAKQLERFIYDKSENKNRTIGRIPGLATWIHDGGFNFKEPKRTLPAKRTVLRCIIRLIILCNRKLRRTRYWKAIINRTTLNNPYLGRVFKTFKIRSHKSAEGLFYAAQLLVVIMFAFLLKEKSTETDNHKELEKLNERLRRNEEYRALRETRGHPHP